jgi:hypothetical protein
MKLTDSQAAKRLIFTGQCAGICPRCSIFVTGIGGICFAKLSTSHFILEGGQYGTSGEVHRDLLSAPNSL